MRKINQLQENLFSTIAKTLALVLIKNKLKKTPQSTDFDKDVQTFVIAADNLNKKLDIHCKSHPDDFRCKEYRSK